ncbi:hypothetical protein [Nonomuraea glycinis]|uniref:hypothetical protein n=1 Tax=Nonomuraea glycinis TaxID=2047744 RepID=UPI002E148EEE|nr:hypothetical protein OHA68_15665 [Nonomuraea glycinis]
MPLIPVDAPLEAVRQALLARQPLLGRADTAAPHREAEPPAVWREDIAGKNSCGRLRADPVALPVLRHVVGAATAMVAETWPVDAHGDPGFLTVLGAWDVDDLKPGFYTCSPDTADTGGCRLLAGAELLPGLRERYVQAPALLLLTGDFERIPPGADAAYGSLVSRVGALGHAIWRTALAEGLAASLFGRTSREVTGLVSRLQPGQRHLFTVALGHPA